MNNYKWCNVREGERKKEMERMTERQKKEKEFILNKPNKCR